MNAKRRRDWGKKSPIDKLPSSVRAELARLMQTSATFREIARWLAEKHGFKPSAPALCEWNKRREQIQRENAEKINWNVIEGGPFQITVAAPSASEVKVSVTPISPARSGPAPLREARAGTARSPSGTSAHGRKLSRKPPAKSPQ